MYGQSWETLMKTHQPKYIALAHAFLWHPITTWEFGKTDRYKNKNGDTLKKKNLKKFSKPRPSQWDNRRRCIDFNVFWQILTLVIHEL